MLCMRLTALLNIRCILFIVLDLLFFFVAREKRKQLETFFSNLALFWVVVCLYMLQLIISSIFTFTTKSTDVLNHPTKQPSNNTHIWSSFIKVIFHFTIGKNKYMIRIIICVYYALIFSIALQIGSFSFDGVHDTFCCILLNRLHKTQTIRKHY